MLLNREFRVSSRRGAEKHHLLRSAAEDENVAIKVAYLELPIPVNRLSENACVFLVHRPIVDWRDESLLTAEYVYVIR